MEHTNSLHEIVLENNIPKLISYLSYLKKNNKINQYINKYNNECKTPLHLAVKNNLQDVSKILVKFGASTELVDDMGQKVVWIPEQKGGSKKCLGKRYI